jgi:hypothetical protein
VVPAAGARPLPKPARPCRHHKSGGWHFWAEPTALNATTPAIGIAASGGLGPTLAAALAIHKARVAAVPGLADDTGAHFAHWDRQPQSLCMAWSSSFSSQKVRVVGPLAPVAAHGVVLLLWLAESEWSWRLAPVAAHGGRLPSCVWSVGMVVVGQPQSLRMAGVSFLLCGLGLVGCGGQPQSLRMALVSLRLCGLGSVGCGG